MKFTKDFWILGKPLHTAIGDIRFIKVHEYEELMKNSDVLLLDKQDFLDIFKKNAKGFTEQEVKEIIEGFSKRTYFELIKEFRFSSIYELFSILFDFCFLEKGCFDKIQNQEELDFYCDLIKEMNCLSFKKPSKNPELAYYDKLEMISKEKRGEIVTFQSMISHVALRISDVDNLTLYRLHNYFDAIGQEKNDYTANLFRTVSTEAIDCKPWYYDSSIDKITLNETDKEFIRKHMGLIQTNPENKGVVEEI